MTREEIKKQWELEFGIKYQEYQRANIYTATDILDFAESIVNKLLISDVMQWVSVEDKLPPKYENVIVRNENDIVSTDQISDNGWVYEQMSCLKVTHWMYLPKPPCA